MKNPNQSLKMTSITALKHDLTNIWIYFNGGLQMIYILQMYLCQDDSAYTQIK